MMHSLPPPASIGPGRAMVLLLGWFAGTVLFAVLIFALARFTGLIDESSLAGAAALLEVPGIELICALGATGMVAYAGWKDSGLSWPALFPWRASGRAYLAGLILVFGAGTLISEFTNLLAGLIPMPEWMLRSTIDDGPTGPIELVLLVVLVAPLTEELIMRGIILRRLRVRLGAGRALVLSSVLFGLAHGYPVQIIAAALIGLVLGWIFLRTNSLLIPIVGHAFNNAIVAGFYLSGVEIPGVSSPPQPGVLVLQPWWLDVFGVACVLVAWRMFRALPPAETAPLPPVLPTPAPASDPT